MSQQTTYPKVEIETRVDTTSQPGYYTLTITHVRYYQPQWSCKILFDNDAQEVIFDPDDADVLLGGDKLKPDDPRFSMLMTEDRVDRALESCMAAIASFAEDEVAKREAVLAVLSVSPDRKNTEYLN